MDFFNFKYKINSILKIKNELKVYFGPSKKTNYKIHIKLINEGKRTK